MDISAICFILAAIMALTGMTMGIYMGAMHDFTLAPAHAHLNLLGWVTLAIYGLYHRRASRAAMRLRWAQVATGSIAAPAMALGLALLLSAPAGSDLAGIGETAIIGGSLLALVSMLLFLVVVVGDIRRRRQARRSAEEWGLPDLDPASG